MLRVAKKRERVSVDHTECESRDKAAEALPEEVQSKRDYATSDIRNHYIELDALRGIAILAVFTLHATQSWSLMVEKPLNIPILNLDLLKMGGMGGLGVMLFFLLSGYLLTWTEERRARDGNYSLRSYAFRRALRLLPAYYAALVVGFLLWPTGKTFMDVVSHLTLMQGFVPHLPRIAFDPVFWSLTPEVVFYILLPFLILKVRGFYPRLALMGVLLVASLVTRICIELYASEGEWLVYYLLMIPTAHL